MFACSMCNFVGQLPEELTLHIVKYHSKHRYFVINCSICGGTWQKFESFQRHVYWKHLNLNLENNDDIVPNNDVDMENVPTISHNEMVEQYGDKLLMCSANYILRLKSDHIVSEACINDIMSHSNDLIKLTSMATKSKLLAQCASQQPDITERVQQIWESACYSSDVFSGVHIKALQNKFFREKFHMLDPQPFLWERVILLEQKRMVNI